MDDVWGVPLSREHYRIAEWGQGFFDVSEEGHVVVRPAKDGAAIDLLAVVEGLRERELAPPVLLRFPGITAYRMRELRRAFDRAISEVGYDGTYTCVYPMKVNPARHVCEEVRDIAAELGFGLEVGTKPELLAALTLSEAHDDMLIICNGFKDEEYLELVVHAGVLGRRIIPVLEQLDEVDRMIQLAERHGVRPKLGLRAKLWSRGMGRWAGSSGDRGKFGLSASQILKAARRLEAAGLLDSLTLLHFHIGSQVSDIRRLKDAVSELAYLYVEMRRLGAPISMLDVGGGLGVDYDGTASATESSVNYGPAEYALDVVHRVASVCDAEEVPHPDLVSESGRAISAYSSVLVCEVVGATRFDTLPDLDTIRTSMEAQDDPPRPIADLLDAYDRAADAEAAELLHDVTHARHEAASLFRFGYLTLELYAASEELAWSVSRRVLERDREDPAAELEDVPEALSDILFVNLSLFQSLPDSWAIDQIFPTMPIHRLCERPTRRAVLADMTCDSDGMIDRFVGPEKEDRSLAVHPFDSGNGGEPYYIGIFLVGAYQETLGDLHNLFGDTHAVHVQAEPGGGWRLEHVVDGDTVREVLGYVQFDHEEMRASFRRSIERAIRAERLTVAEGNTLRKFLEEGLEGYTYPE